MIDEMRRKMAKRTARARYARQADVGATMQAVAARLDMAQMNAPAVAQRRLIAKMKRAIRKRTTPRSTPD